MCSRSEMTVRRSVTLAAALVAFVITATGCSPSPIWRSPSTTNGTSAPGGTIDWSPCGAEALKLNPKLPRTYTVECGTVTVPQDWTTAKDGKATDGKTFAIALMRIRSDKQHDRLGSVLTNPGGPSGSGVDFVPYHAGQLPNL